MRRPTYLFTPHETSQPAQKPKFSQRSGRQDFTLEGMPVGRPKRTHPSRTRQTQGIALVVVLLSAMVLMVSLLAISATMTISSQRTTADQSVTLPAQYAAEAGVARATASLAEINRIMGLVDVTNSTRTQIENHARSYCGVSGLNSVPSNPPADFELCRVPDGADTGYSSRYSIFTSYPLKASNTYPSGVSSANFWKDAFSRAPITTRVAVDSTTGSETQYTLTYGLTPTRVLLVSRNFYRFEFTVAPAESIGEMRVSNTIIATRKIQQQNSGTYSFSVEIPSYARNHIFRYETTSTTGGPLSFAGGETFNGPVHTNAEPNFSKNSSGTPTFNSDFSTCFHKGNFSNYSGATTDMKSDDMKSTFKGSAPLYNLDPCPKLPKNSNNQKRASFGGDASNTAPLTDTEMQTAWGVKYQTTQPSPYANYFYCLYTNPRHPLCQATVTDSPMPNGVYYSKGDGATTPNQSTSWTNNATDNSGGGIYINGNVDQLKLCTNANSGANKGLQIIGIKQGSTTTTFQENKDGTWSVRTKTSGDVNCNASPSSNTNGSEVKKLSGKFNGMIYVDGDISDMRGDGSTDPDIALNSKLMVTGTGKIVIKDSLTYTEMPTKDNKSMANVLGIYSSGEKCEPVATSTPSCGSVLVDGPNNQDLDIHASIMATKEVGIGSRKGEGFGTVNAGAGRGDVHGRKVQINLLGGIIERQSQTVSLNGGGYNRNYDYDLRFSEGFAPPFFPEQAEGGESAVVARWTTKASPFSTAQSLWQTVGK